MRRRLLIVLAAAAIIAAFLLPGSAQATRYGVDYSSFTLSRINPQTFLNAGYSFVARYLCPPPNSKALTPAEADRFSAGGVDIVVVWESTATRALTGYSAGYADAARAYPQATADGMPDDRPVYFAVDTDTTWAKVQPYFAGVLAYLNALHPRGDDWHPAKHVGIYGGYKVVRDALASGNVTWGWQTVAWSYGARVDRHFLQFSFNVYICGVGGDGNKTLAAAGDDFGQWRSTRIHFNGKALPTPGSRTLSYTHGQPLETGGDVSWLQSRLNALMPEMPALSGNLGFDVLTKCAVIRFQDKFGIGADDGVVGPDTWSFIIQTVPGERTIGVGNQGPDVLFLQKILNVDGYPCGKADGIFGAATKRAVEKLQKTDGILADGIVSRVTWDIVLSLPH